MKKTMLLSLTFALISAANSMPECFMLDLNHDGVVNVQDLQIAVNRHDKPLFDRIERFILTTPNCHCGSSLHERRTENQ